MSGDATTHRLGHPRILLGNRTFEEPIPRSVTLSMRQLATFGVGYRAPVECLKEQGIHPRVLVETGPPSGPVSGAQVPGQDEMVTDCDAAASGSSNPFPLYGYKRREAILLGRDIR